jgi:GNAT superfamily N-acetyltransferase
MGRFTVREVDGRRNAALLLRLQREALPHDRPIATTQGWWFIAYDGERPVGFSGMYLSTQWSDTVYLCRAGVLERARGHGLQKRLIRARIRKAKALGYCWAVTDTYENPESGNSLIRCGFRLFQPSRPWGADGVNYWRRSLSL